MRGLLIFLLPVLLMAQAPSTQPKPASPSKPATARKPVAAKPARKPLAAKPAPAARPAAPALTTDQEKTIYAAGLSLYRTLAQLDPSPAEIAIVQRALADAAAGKPAVELNEWGPKIQPLIQERTARVAEREKASSAAFIDKAAAQPGAEKTNSGLVYRATTPGTGPSPKATDTVKVHYRGTLVNGTEFDSSYKRNEPAEFALNGVIPCWTEGVQKMNVGGKAMLVCPSDLAYGDRGRPSIPGGAALIFEIELLEIVAPPAAAAPAPAAPAEAPKP
ncbi:MAG TPA: FKBP-type peptidyl-prolyl cis-trans isomerase [Bryobacteraceae bacterium]|nr:FKBP-type peptidyl-prolyl cis-trans isomerase [Bryobacteraceae bacterium]